MIDTVNFYTQDNDFNSNFVISYMLFIIGVKGNNSASEPALIYGNNIPDNFDGIFIQKKQNEFFNLKEIEQRIATPRKNIDIDIIQLVESFISDKVNLENSRAEFDVHERVKFSSSHQYANGYANQPVVNLIIKLLEKTFDAFFPITKEPLWPQNKQSVVVLSHDVDAPIKYAHLFNHGLLPRRGTNPARHYYQLLRYTKDYILDSNKDDFWLFDEVSDFEKSLGFKSTFFFAVVDNKQKGSDWRDVDYKITDKRFVSAFEKIKANGSEIGLHASYNAFESAANFVTEKQTLEKLAHVKVTGLRHHYWHLGKNYRNTLKYHDQAGFMYDCSISFNDFIGFRNNIALPYPILFDKEKKSLNLIEIPSFIMDGNIFYNKLSVEEGFKQITSAINILKANNGIGSIDWHVRTSYPKNKEYKSWGELYVKTLKWLATDNSIWVTSTQEVVDWLKLRKQKLIASDNEYARWLR